MTVVSSWPLKLLQLANTLQQPKMKSQKCIDDLFSDIDDEVRLTMVSKGQRVSSSSEDDSDVEIIEGPVKAKAPAKNLLKGGSKSLSKGGSERISKAGSTKKQLQKLDSMDVEVLASGSSEDKTDTPAAQERINLKAITGGEAAVKPQADSDGNHDEERHVELDNHFVSCY